MLRQPSKKKCRTVHKSSCFTEFGFRTIVVLVKMSLALPSCCQDRAAVPSRRLTRPCQQTLARPGDDGASGTSSAPSSCCQHSSYSHVQHFPEREGGTGQRDGCKSNVWGCVRCRTSGHLRFDARPTQKQRGGWVDLISR